MGQDNATRHEHTLPAHPVVTLHASCFPASLTASYTTIVSILRPCPVASKTTPPSTLLRRPPKDGRLVRFPALRSGTSTSSCPLHARACSCPCSCSGQEEGRRSKEERKKGWR